MALRTGQLSYEQFKRKIYQLSNQQKVGHMCPNNNIMYNLWEKGWTPEQVVSKHCTVAAQRKRHGLDQGS